MRAVEQVVEVICVVAALHDGIIYLRPLAVEPADNVRVYPAKRGEIDARRAGLSLRRFGLLHADRLICVRKA